MFETLRKYRYTDTPDGEDTLLKLWCASKVSGAIAFGWSVTDVLLYSHPKTYLATLSRIAYVSLPILGMSTAFVLVSNIAANVRQKDDKANWVFGACSAGAIFGTWRRSPIAGLAAMFVFSWSAILKKHALQHNWTLAEFDFKQRQGGVWSVHQDYTLIKHRPGNWTTGKD